MSKKSAPKELGWKSRRITKVYRAELLTRIISSVFGDRDEALLVKEHALGESIYKLKVTPHLAEHMSRLPENFFTRNTSTKFELEGYRRTLRFSKALPLPQYCSYGGSLLELSEPSTLGKRFQALQEEKTKRDQDRSELKAKISGLLNAANTEKQLVNIWPEALTYLIPPPKKEENLPVPDNTEVNKMLRKLGTINKKTS